MEKKWNKVKALVWETIRESEYRCLRIDVDLKKDSELFFPRVCLVAESLGGKGHMLNIKFGEA